MCVRSGALLHRLFGLALGAGALCLACRDGQAPQPTPSVPAAATTSARQQPAKKYAPARLGVVVIFDQLGSEVLLRHADLLSEQGVLRTTMRRGVYFERSRYPFANTLTAVGHATIATGALPKVHGVFANEVWDPAVRKLVPAVADPKGPVFGRAGALAGPARLRAQTLAEALKQSTKGRGKVVSLSIKDRAAVFSVGGVGDTVAFFDRKRGGFTTSKRYAKQMPAWIQAFESEHPLASLFSAWVARSPALYRERLGPDNAPGEGLLDGDSSFPHQIRSKSQGFGLLPLLPQLSEYLVALAERAVAVHALGVDETPDLLVLSISGTDYAGHYFGPDSWEYVDHLIRADEAVGRWLTRLEGQTSVALAVTSDHGVAPLPERAPKRLAAGEVGRFEVAPLQRRLEAAVGSVHGRGPWLQKLSGPLVYLSAKARAARVAGAVRRQVQEWLGEQAVVEQVVDIRDGALALPIALDGARQRRLAATVRRGIPPGSGADFYVVYRKHFVETAAFARKRGTNHGTPHEYDAMVPLLFRGPGVGSRRLSMPVSQLQVAPTMAALLGVPSPSQATSDALVP